MPVEVLGTGAAPGVGELLTVVENEASAREVADYQPAKRGKPPQPDHAPLRLTK